MRQIRLPLLLPLLLALLLFLHRAPVLSAPDVSTARPPLVPFDRTADLFVMENQLGHILRVQPDKKITIEITGDQIRQLTGESDINFEQNGLVVDGSGTLYFTEGVSGMILKKGLGEEPAVLTSSRAIRRVTGRSVSDPEGIAFGADGLLYVNEDESQSVLRVDPADGEVKLYANQEKLHGTRGINWVNLDAYIVGDEQGAIYTVSSGSPIAVIKIAPGGEPSLLARDSRFNQPEIGYMTRASNGDLIIADDGGHPDFDGDNLYRIAPDGEVSLFLARTHLEQAAGGDVILGGGIAFDSGGAFYLAEEARDNILRFDGTTGVIWLSAAAIMAVTGVEPDLDGGIAFAPLHVSYLPVAAR